jgi:uncharacterized ferritin-like protein (DUF455 family)
MSARAYAYGIVTGTTLAAKLAPPPRGLAIADREPPLCVPAPGRPPELAIVPGRATRVPPIAPGIDRDPARRRPTRVPPIAGMRDPAQRARILHALANHELQAIELFAWALLAFPDAPATFRRGLVAILADEQRHLALYIDRLAAHATRFGDHAVTGHFWNKLDHYATPLAFACAMGLTFEHANLDLSGDYAAAARACGDAATADAIDRVHADEIRHVRFAWTWLRRLGGDADPWQVYLANVRPPLGPARARGPRLDRDARRRAGLTDAFVDELARIGPTRPSGAPR